MTDITWLSAQARSIHDLFYGLFYGFVSVFLVIGIFVEYFKWPLGGMPSFTSLIGRVFIAALLLHSYPEVTNALADVTDSISGRLGNLNEVHLVMHEMVHKWHQQSPTWWLGFKETIIWIISFASSFFLYFSVFIAEALLLYSWTLLYVFSPLLIALYVLPSTAGATSALYRSLIEASCWKIVWSVIATLAWSAALSDVNQPGHDINFVTAICINLILAGSLLSTPIVVHGLAGAGVSGIAKTVSGIAIGGAAIGPMKVLSMSSKAGQFAFSKTISPMTKSIQKEFSGNSSRKQTSPKKGGQP